MHALEGTAPRGPLLLGPMHWDLLMLPNLCAARDLIITNFQTAEQSQRHMDTFMFTISFGEGT